MGSEALTCSSPRGLVVRPVLKNSGLATGQSSLHRKPGQSGAGLLCGGLPAPDLALRSDHQQGSRRDSFGGQIPLHFRAASGGRRFLCLSSRGERIGTLEAVFAPSLAFGVALLTDADGVFAQLRAERFFNEQDRFEG